MDDDGADWMSAAADDEPAAAPAAEAPKAAEEVGGEAPAEGGQSADAEAEEAAAAEAEGEYLDPDKLLLFKHWIRPRYLQYRYLYEYRRNYYDDVMEAVERRQKGFRRDIPRPQTWAERALRTYNDPLRKLEEFDRRLEDVRLVTRSEISGTFYNYYAKQNFNKRYSKLLY
ncbi:flightin isoform X2 [Cylas formicarius]|uniref:flightin isoform X2 n=1 Tax=Cylas formicarius TaxID=197179 RepID=UPI0029587123|nr:flightin isoform X2 [Cylas formicarius]